MNTKTTRTRLYTALREHTLGRHLGLIIGLVVATPATQAAGLSHDEWVCRPRDNGGIWSCTERRAPGKAYPRPQHRTPEGPQDPNAEPRVQITRNLDWVDEEGLSDAQRAQMAPGCCGAYIEPPRNYPDSDKNPDDAPMRVGSTVTQAQGTVATLEGDVQVSQGYRQVRSDRATLDQEARTVDLEGHVQFREPGMLLTSEKAHVNIDSKELDADNATFVFHDSAVRGTAGHFARSKSDIIYINNATYTSCEPGNNAWLLRSAQVKIDGNTGIATARHVRLAAKGVPMLYLPWVRYPVGGRRASGLLFPHISSGSDNGIDYAQPVYLNLAPNYDATLTPRHLQERGPMLEVEARHLSGWSETTLSAAHLWDDAGGDDPDEGPDPVTGLLPHEGEDRWLIGASHKGGFGHHWNTEIDYAEVSDVDYFQDLGNATLEVNSQTHLRQMVSAGYNLANWQLKLTGQKFQTLIEGDPQQYRQLPEATADGDYRFDRTDLVLTLENQYTQFDHNNPARVTGGRLRTDYQVIWDKEWLWGFFRPSLILKHLAYDLDRPLSDGDANPSVTVPVGAVDAGLFFERDTTWLKGYIQTFEPRLYYLHTPYEDQSAFPNFDTSTLTFSYNQLFRDDRFSGGDRIGDAEQVSIGLSTRLIENDTGIERLRASLGQIYYLDDRFVSTNRTLTQDFLESLNDPGSLNNLSLRDLATELLQDHSDYAAELGGQLSDNWRMQTDLLYNEDSGKINKGSFSLRYHNRDDALFNVAYRYTRRNPLFMDIDGDSIADEVSQDIDQADLSFILPVVGNLSVIGRWNQDLTNSRELEIFGGLEYESCCWRVSVIARRWLDRQDTLLLPEENLEHDAGIFFQIQLKGLAGTGKRIDNILEDGIYGYEPKER